MGDYENNNQEPNFVLVDETPDEKTSDNYRGDVYGDVYGAESYSVSSTNDTVEADSMLQSDYTPASDKAPEYDHGQQTYTYGEPQVQTYRVKKKEPKYVTRKAFIITLIICMLATSGLTIGGYTLAMNMGVANTTKRVSATNFTLAKATGSEKSIEEIIAMNENAVVEIRTEKVSTDFWLQNYITEGAGSGVIIDTKGYIITNNHVIDGASKIKVTLKDGTELQASLVGTDPQNDVAVIKVNATNLTAASYGDSSELSVGDLVIAIGNPLGQLGGTATQGIISALDRELTIDNNTLTLLQTDASINPGNSGGGLFDQYGHLVGIVVAKSSGSDVEGLGFAIPINTAAEVAKQLIETGKAVANRPAIGISILDASDAQVAMQYNLRYTGVYIQEVNSKKAKKAGLKEGDLIYYFDDTKIENANDLTTALSKHKIGDIVQMTVIRDNQTVDIEVELVELES